MDFELRVIHSVHEIEAEAWDAMSEGKPFQSHRWYAYGEDVMSDCLPIYLIVYSGGMAIARATFFLIRNEPLPLPAGLHWPLKFILRRWPLMICRSPLSSTSGLILPESPLRAPALRALISEARRLARRYRASFLIFDFLEGEQSRWSEWPDDFVSLTVPEPGTRLEISWSTFEEYLNQRSPKTRKHYRQHLRAAERLGITVTAHESVTEVEAALRLIRAVERRHRAAPNPWIRAMLQEAAQIGALWLAARIEGRLVGCELLLADGSAQLVTALGLEAGHPEVYFLLGYADIRHAIESGARLLRWGSGAYEAKRRLGFKTESNNHAMAMGRGLFYSVTSWIRERRTLC